MRDEHLRSAAAAEQRSARRPAPSPAAPGAPAPGAASSAPAVPSAEIPVPNWGRLIAGPCGTAAWNRRHADEIAQAIPHHLVLVSLRPFARRETRLGGSHVRTRSAPSGATEIVPAGADYWARWHEEKEVTAFSLPAAWLDRLALEHFDRPAAAVDADALPVHDARTAALGRFLRDELRRGGPPGASPVPPGGGATELFLDAVLTLLGVHLLRHYARRAGGDGAAARPAGLGSRRLAAVRAYLGEHLAAPVRLDDLARAASLSPSHFVRAFRQETGTTPHRYVVRLRLDRARELLTRTALPLAAVAAATGFASQSHLTALLRREDGVTPGALRREPEVRAAH